MKKYRFEARIESASGGGAYVFFPGDSQKEFGSRARIPVRATFNGAPYTGSLVKYGFPQLLLHVPKATRTQLGKEVGDTITVEVWKDEAERTLEIPAEFRKLLGKEKLLPIFEKLSYTHRKEYIRWVSGAKKEETRSRRLDKSVAMLKSGVKTPG